MNKTTVNEVDVRADIMEARAELEKAAGAIQQALFKIGDAAGKLTNGARHTLDQIHAERLRKEYSRLLDVRMAVLHRNIAIRRIDRNFNSPAPVG